MHREGFHTSSLALPSLSPLTSPLHQDLSRPQVQPNSLSVSDSLVKFPDSSDSSSLPLPLSHASGDSSSNSPEDIALFNHFSTPYGLFRVSSRHVRRRGVIMALLCLSYFLASRISLVNTKGRALGTHKTHTHPYIYLEREMCDREGGIVNSFNIDKIM